MKATRGSQHPENTWLEMGPKVTTPIFSELMVRSDTHRPNGEFEKTSGNTALE